MKNVLIFAYYWPPASGGGVWRSMKFAKFLPEYGWNPIIVTVKNGSYPFTDESLLGDLPEDIEVYHTASFEPFAIYNALRGKKGKAIPEAMGGIKNATSTFQKLAKHIRANYFVPDPRVGWVRYAAKEGARIIKEKEIHAIFTTSPPNSAQLIGLRLKKKFGIPWVADLRDPWTNSFINKQFLTRKPSVEQKDKALEDEVMYHADVVLGVGREMASEFRDRAKRVEVLYNGFDESDLHPSTAQQSDKFRLSYIGSLKPNHDVEALWQVLEDLIAEETGFADDFRFLFVGSMTPAIYSKLEQKNFAANLEPGGFVSHAKAVSLMQSANLLLLIVPQAEGNKGLLTGKVFEYMGSATAILGLGPADGDAAYVLKEGGRGKMIEYADYQQIKAHILEQYHLWKSNNGVSPKHTEEGYQQFSRKRITGQLAQVLNEISK